MTENEIKEFWAWVVSKMCTFAALSNDPAFSPEKRAGYAKKADAYEFVADIFEDAPEIEKITSGKWRGGRSLNDILERFGRGVEK